MRCNATSRRTGEHCKNNAVRGSTKCRMHGGKTPRGIASPNFKHGRYSDAIPPRMRDRYEKTLNDSRYKELREEVALVDGLIEDAVRRLDTGESGWAWKKLRQAWSEFQNARRRQNPDDIGRAIGKIEDLIQRGHSDQTARDDVLRAVEKRKRLAESERKRAVENQQMLSMEQAGAFMAAVEAAVRQNVTDRRLLDAIGRDLEAIAGGGLPRPDGEILSPN